MKIYPEKPKANAASPSVKGADAYVLCHKVGIGEIKFETACAKLGLTGKEFDIYLTRFKSYVEDIKEQMQSFKGSTQTELVSSIAVAKELYSKSDVIDTLLDRWTAEGTFLKYKDTLI